jgi:arabinan endo-1,5-alpha-L-arabinosidase
MKYLVLAAFIVVASVAVALDGQIGIHDPSTVVQCDGRYYTFGTGGTALVSDDGWTWRAGTRAPRAGMAPDLIHIGDRYYQYIARNVGAQPKAEINMIWSKSLDPNSPDYKWVEGGVVVSTNGIEDCNGIDPGTFLDPTTGRLWLTYGSYFGYIRVVELNPKTGMRLYPNLKPFDVAINCEASTMIYRDGWYYLLATHGSCCRGADSGYNIRVGRGRKPTGPFLDDNGIDMIQGGGTLLIGSGGRLVGAGHFGLLDLGEGVQKFSMHWEADFDRGGASVIDIRPLLWKNGWPVAGENAREGTYEIESVRTGTALELAVEGIPVGGRRAGRGGAGIGPGAGAGPAGGQAAPGGAPQAGGPPRGAPGATPPTGARGAGAPQAGEAAGRGGVGGGMFAGSGSPLPDQDVNQVSANWPSGNLDARMSNYLCQAQQKWTLKAVPNGGGYPGSPYFRITVAGTERTLAATEEGELVVLPAFSGGPEQLWRLDQLADGSWRIMPKAVPNAKGPMALSAIGASSATLSTYDPAGNKHRWLLKRP